MTSKGIFSISLKLIGIYSFIQSIFLLQPFGMFISTYSKLIEEDLNLPLMYFAALLPSLILIIMAFVLFFLSDGIANRFIVPNQTSGSQTTLSKKDIQSLAFSIIGVVIFLLAFTKIVQFASSILFAYQNAKEPSQLLNLPYTIGITLQLVLGLALFFGAKPLSMFWHRLAYEWNSDKEKT